MVFKKAEKGCCLCFMLGVFSVLSLDGLATFRNFLKSEYSDENIEFWLTCEDYKKIKSSFRMSSKAKKIYEQFIKAESPKEVSLNQEMLTFMREHTIWVLYIIHYCRSNNENISQAQHWSLTVSL